VWRLAWAGRISLPRTGRSDSETAVNRYRSIKPEYLILVGGMQTFGLHTYILSRDQLQHSKWMFFFVPLGWQAFEAWLWSPRIYWVWSISGFFVTALRGLDVGEQDAGNRACHADDEPSHAVLERPIKWIHLAFQTALRSRLMG
jgi:hypothetical protein